MDWETLQLLRHLADFGMVVVLWLVQLVIYPSFLKVRSGELVAWHQRYTFRVSFVIMPLMLGQLALSIYFLRETGSLADVLAFGCVSAAWILTFFVSVPLHRKIDKGEGSDVVLRRLVLTNWPRTILWSAAFAFGLA